MGLRNRLSTLAVGRPGRRSGTERKSILARVKGKAAARSEKEMALTTKERTDDLAPMPPGFILSADAPQSCDRVSAPSVVDVEAETKHDDDRYLHNEGSADDDGDWDLALNPYPSDTSMELQADDMKAPIMNELMRETSVEVLMRCHAPSLVEVSRGETTREEVEEDVDIDGPKETAVAAAVAPLLYARSSSTYVSIQSDGYLDDKYENIEGDAPTNEDWDLNVHPYAEEKLEQGGVTNNKNDNDPILPEFSDDESTAVLSLTSIFSEPTILTARTDEIIVSKPPRTCTSDAEEVLDDFLDESKCPLFSSFIDKLMPPIDEEEVDAHDARTVHTAQSSCCDD